MRTQASREQLAGHDTSVPETHETPDEDLEIGADDENDAIAAQALAEPVDEADIRTRIETDPAAKALFDQAVALKVAEIEASRGLAADPRLAGQPDAILLIKELVAGLGRELAASNAILAAQIAKNTAVAAEQQPGYVKPLAPEEIEARAEALANAEAFQRDLIKQVLLLSDAGEREAAMALAPQYLLTEDAYFDDEYRGAGETHRYFRMPSASMEPRNENARKMKAYTVRYSGGEKVDSTDLVAEAMAARKALPSGMGLPDFELLSGRSDRSILLASRVIEAGVEEVGPEGIHGTKIQVTRGGLVPGKSWTIGPGGLPA
jgi:hypothetical protein